MFDIKQIQQNAKQSEKTLNAIKVKMKDLDVEFKKLETNYKSKDEEYYIKNPKDLDEINEQIKKRLSVYDLMLEVAEDLSEKTADDLESIMIEFQNGNYYKHD
jgi:predicted nuclease with TOPRIM domain